MRLHIIADVYIEKARLDDLKRMLSDYGVSFNGTDDVHNDMSRFVLTVEFDGDHEIGLSVMDIIDNRPHQYQLAYIKDSDKVIPLMEKFV